MGTRASVKLQTLRGDALMLYTRWDGTQEFIKELGSNLNERWSRNVGFVEKWVQGKEGSFPVLAQWCQETNAFLAQPETLGGAANLVSSASLNHLHPSMSQPIGYKEDERQARVQEELNDADYCLTPNFWGEGHTRTRGSKNIKPKFCEKGLISIQYAMGEDPTQPVWNEVLYETTHVAAEEVLRDLLTLPRFFREFSLIARNKNLRETTGADILTDLSDLLERARGLSFLDRSSDRSKPITKSEMLSSSNSMLTFGSHLSLLGQHLALLRPSVYQPCTAAQYLEKPNRLLELKIDDAGERMVEARVSVAPERQNKFAKGLKRVVKEEEVRRTEGDLATLFEGHSPVGLETKGDAVHLNYVEDVINVLHTVANVPCAQINDVIERGLLRKRVGEKLLNQRKQSKAL